MKNLYNLALCHVNDQQKACNICYIDLNQVQGPKEYVEAFVLAYEQVSRVSGCIFAMVFQTMVMSSLVIVSLDDNSTTALWR
jgi:hypothetical protein